MPLIKESFRLSATNADVLAAPSRLAAIPSNGVLTIEASSRDSTATNSGQLTLQLPDGEVPFEDLIVPANGLSGDDDVMNQDTQLTIVVPVGQGGHVGLSYEETGANVCLLIVSLTF